MCICLHIVAQYHAPVLDVHKAEYIYLRQWINLHLISKAVISHVPIRKQSCTAQEEFNDYSERRERNGTVNSFIYIVMNFKTDF